MQRIVLIALVFTVSSTIGHAAPSACERLEQQRDRVYQQLRRPHSAERGNQLRSRLRELDSRIAHGCR